MSKVNKQKTIGNDELLNQLKSLIEAQIEGRTKVPEETLDDGRELLNAMSVGDLMFVIKGPGFTRAERSAAAKEVWARRSPKERSAVANKAVASRAAVVPIRPETTKPATNGLTSRIDAMIVELLELRRRS